MLHWIKYLKFLGLILFLAVVVLEGCNKADEGSRKNLIGIDFGDVKYWDKFLWSEEHPAVADKTLIFEFNESALENNEDGWIEISIQPRSMPDKAKAESVQLRVNGEEVEGSKTVLYLKDFQSKESEVHIGVSIKKGSPSGEYEGTINMRSNFLDRINQIAIGSEEYVPVMQWRLSYEPRWNPLAKSLFWIFVVIMGGFLFWMAVLKHQVYPRMSGMIQLSDGSVINLVGHIAYYLYTNKPPKEAKNSFLSRILRGKIGLYKLNTDKDLILNDAFIKIFPRKGSRGLRNILKADNLLIEGEYKLIHDETYKIKDRESGEVLDEIYYINPRHLS